LNKYKCFHFSGARLFEAEDRLMPIYQFMDKSKGNYEK